MYSVNCTVKGVAPLMQHRYPMPDLASLNKGGKRSSGEKDYSQEWREYLYYDANNMVYQPGAHFEGALTKAAASFKVKGKRGASYKDLFKGSVFVTPDHIPHNVQVPDELDADADKQLYLDMRPVVVMRARVVRLRPCFKTGWELSFSIDVLDDGIPDDLLQDVLVLAGKAVGVGDFRPKFGRFQVVKFEVQK